MKLFTRHMPMRKFLVIVFIFNLFCLFVPHIVQANDYNKAVVGHVISEKIKGTNIDTSYIMEQEIEKLAHKFMIDSVTILQAYLPQIIEGIAADLRLQLDDKYKEQILNGNN